jgi:hypothetical protein
MAMLLKQLLDLTSVVREAMLNFFSSFLYLRYPFLNWFHCRSRAPSSEAKIPTVRDASPISSASSDSESSEDEDDDDDDDESDSEESGSDSEENEEEENEKEKKQRKVEKMDIDKKVDAGKKVWGYTYMYGGIGGRPPPAIHSTYPCVKGVRLEVQLLHQFRWK